MVEKLSNFTNCREYNKFVVFTAAMRGLRKKEIEGKMVKKVNRIKKIQEKVNKLFEVSDDDEESVEPEIIVKKVKKPKKKKVIVVEESDDEEEHVKYVKKHYPPPTPVQPIVKKKVAYL